MSKKNLHSGLQHSLLTTQIVFFSGHLTSNQITALLQFNITSKQVFSPPTTSLSMPCRTSCTHCSNFPCPISLMPFLSISWEKTLNVPITREARQKLSQHELPFVSSHQLFSRNVNVFVNIPLAIYPSFRVKIPLKIKALQATFTRNTCDYSLTNTLWADRCFSFLNCCDSYPSIICWKIGSLNTPRVCELFSKCPRQDLHQITLEIFPSMAFISWGTTNCHSLPSQQNKSNENIPHHNITDADFSSSAQNGKNRTQEINNQGETCVKCRIYPYNLIFKNYSWNLQNYF